MLVLISISLLARAARSLFALRGLVVRLRRLARGSGLGLLARSARSLPPLRSPRVWTAESAGKFGAKILAGVRRSVFFLKVFFWGCLFIDPWGGLPPPPFGSPPLCWWWRHGTARLAKARPWRFWWGGFAPPARALPSRPPFFALPFLVFFFIGLGSFFSGLRPAPLGAGSRALGALAPYLFVLSFAFRFLLFFIALLCLLMRGAQSPPPAPLAIPRRSRGGAGRLRLTRLSAFFFRRPWFVFFRAAPPAFFSLALARRAVPPALVFFPLFFFCFPLFFSYDLPCG